jgi:hypothetical protein
MTTTTICLPTITLTLCPQGTDLYNNLMLAVADAESAPCLDTKNDCHDAMKRYFYHRRGIQNRDGSHKINPCPYCRVETFDATR